MQLYVCICRYDFTQRSLVYDTYAVYVVRWYQCLINLLFPFQVLEQKLTL